MLKADIDVMDEIIRPSDGSSLCQKRGKPHPSLSFLHPHIAKRGTGGKKGNLIVTS